MPSVLWGVTVGVTVSSVGFLQLRIATQNSRVRRSVMRFMVSVRVDDVSYPLARRPTNRLRFANTYLLGRSKATPEYLAAGIDYARLTRVAAGLE